MGFIPKRYIPESLSEKEREKQKKGIVKSRKAYKKGIYVNRPKLKTYKWRPSKHLKRAYELYGDSSPNFSLKPSKKLAKKTGCTLKSLKKIVNKGEGAYYSSGSRPNQTAQSWGYARLASALTGQNASIVDKDILLEGCHPNSTPIKLLKEKMEKNV